MPRSCTVLEIRDRVRELVDLEGERHVGDGELNSRISSAYAKYYARLVRSGLAYAEEKTQTITASGAATNGATLVPMPGDHFATARVDWRCSTDWWEPLDEIDVRTIDQYQTRGQRALVYRLAGRYLHLLPAPAAGQVYRHIYVPAPAKLTEDTQTIDGVAGWEDAVILDAAVRALIKSESDVSTLLRERDLVDARIDDEAQLRSLTRPRRVALRRSRIDRDPADWWPR